MNVRLSRLPMLSALRGEVPLAREIPQQAKRGRINSAGCTWDNHLCETELDALRNTDRGAWQKMMSLIEDSQDFGLPFDAHGDDYSAPVGDRVKRSEFRGRVPPWLGELRVQERTPKRKSKLGDEAEHRLYFGEPDQPSNAILGLSVREKRGHDRRANRKQTQHMVDAMWKLIHWCEGRSPKTGWRGWDWTV
jgi:hypothetical protein